MFMCLMKSVPVQTLTLHLQRVPCNRQDIGARGELPDQTNLPDPALSASLPGSNCAVGSALSSGGQTSGG